MSKSWLRLAVQQSGRYFQEAFSEPGVLHTFREQLFDLRKPDCVNLFSVFTDKPLGGLTTAQLDFSSTEGEEGCLVFHGDFSSQVPPTAPKNVVRLGQAAFESKDTDEHYIWLGSYERQVASTLDCRIKGDGRIYGVYLKTDSYIEGDGVRELWQAHIRTTAGEWQDVKLPMVDFLLTRRGYMIEEERVVNLSRVTSVGFSLLGGGELQKDGPFKFCVSQIHAGYDEDRSSGNED